MIELRKGCLTLALGMLLCGVVRGQSVGHESFEVASVRASNPNQATGSIRQVLRDGINYQNQALAQFVLFAYDLAPYQLTRGPGVALGERYDIVAKAAGPVSLTQIKLMLRSLLEERFHLMIHNESKNLSVFILTVADGGPRFHPSADSGPMGTNVGKDGVHYTRVPMSYLAGSILSNLPSIGRPVLDRTNLVETYDLSLRLYDPGGSADPKGDLLQQLDNGWRSSLKDLGLKVESSREQVETIVVDHIERPSEN